MISDIARILNDIRVRKTDVAQNMNETEDHAKGMSTLDEWKYVR